MKVHAFEISDHWYLEAADFLGVLCRGDSGYPAWKEAEIYLGATAAGHVMLAQRRYPSDAKKGGDR